MIRSPSVEDLVLGHVLDDRRGGRGGGDGSSSRLGTRKERQTRALLRNAGAPRGWQSVVKRIVGGSARTPQELKCLLDYVAREEGVQSTWCNLAGYERDFDPARTGRTADIWSSTWTGAPRRGHADHIVLSFPRGVDAERAEVIAREWGQAVFGSGEYGDVWRYVAALHKDSLFDKTRDEVRQARAIDDRHALGQEAHRHRSAEKKPEKERCATHAVSQFAQVVSGAFIVETTTVVPSLCSCAAKYLPSARN